MFIEICILKLIQTSDHRHIQSCSSFLQKQKVVETIHKHTTKAIT